MNSILIKGSGDVIYNPEFFDFIVSETEDKTTVVICGGGTKISEALKKSGYPINFDKCGRRVTSSQEELDIVQKVLQEEKRALEQKFVKWLQEDEANIENIGIVCGSRFGRIHVIIPFINAGPIDCPINGDDLVKAYYLGFGEIYVFTLNERVNKKKDIFRDFPKVSVVGL